LKWLGIAARRQPHTKHGTCSQWEVIEARTGVRCLFGRLLSRRSHITHSSLSSIKSANILVPAGRHNLSMWKFCYFQIGSGLVEQHPECHGLVQGSKEGNGQRRVGERIETFGAKFMGAAIMPPPLSSPRASRPSM
jgi:hypothetical protein